IFGLKLPSRTMLAPPISGSMRISRTRKGSREEGTPPHYQTINEGRPFIASAEQPSATPQRIDADGQPAEPSVLALASLASGPTGSNDRLTSALLRKKRTSAACVLIAQSAKREPNQMLTRASASLRCARRNLIGTVNQL